MTHQELIPKLDKLKKDKRGHFFGMTEKEAFEHTGLIIKPSSKKGLKELYKCFENNKKHKKFVKIFDECILFACPVCGDYLGLETDAKTIRFTSSCPYPKGIEFKIELNVPSGKMVVENDLRHLFPINGDFNINVEKNCMLASQAYAEVGMAHAFVGNTCPGLFKINNKYYTIAQTDKSRCLAGIVTDLWWYSIVDADEYTRRGGNIEDVHVVKVPPGVYEFHHVKDHESFDNNIYS